MSMTCNGACRIASAARQAGLGVFFAKLLDTSDFPARWNCGTWTPALGWLHILSDLAIFGAYLSIPLALAFFLSRRKDVPFPRVILLFGLFILSCGVGHAVEAMIFSFPAHRLAGLLKFFTAGISWLTVIATVRIIPEALKLPDIVRLNQRLRQEMDERQQAERELREAKERSESASHAKSLFLAKMSHEIRTPLTAILAEVISVMRVRAVEKGLRLECRWDGPIPGSIETDPARLRQMLMNLVGNAIKFTERGDVLVVVSAPRDRPEPRLVIEVRDTGIGIAPEHLERIFLPFDQADGSITRRFGGTGLGLAISRHIAQGLGGDLRVSSRPGEGSVFVATVATGPLDAAEGSSDQPPCDALTSAGLTTAGPETGEADGPEISSARILLVEDGETNRKLIRMVLRRVGLDVVCATDGRSGAEAAAAGAFDLILMDMQMPVMDGYRATALIRAGGFSGPILALTAHAMRGDAEKCLAAGCSGYLSKPIDVDQLVAAVRGALGARAQAGPGGGPSPAAAAPPAAVRRRPTVTSSFPADDPEFREIAEEFAATLASRLVEMRRAFAQADMPALGRLAHWLKGAGGTAGFDDFTEPAARLEQCAGKGWIGAAGDALRDLEDLASRIELPDGGPDSSPTGSASYLPCP